MMMALTWPQAEQARARAEQQRVQRARDYEAALLELDRAREALAAANESAGAQRAAAAAAIGLG